MDTPLKDRLNNVLCDKLFDFDPSYFVGHAAVSVAVSPYGINSTIRLAGLKKYLKDVYGVEVKRKTVNGHKSTYYIGIRLKVAI
jgi:hypothetical protein